MGKKTYWLVDPETGKVVGEREVGLLTRYGYLSDTTRGKIVKWAALVVLVWLCLTLSALEPSLPFLPKWAFSFADDVVLFVGIAVPLRVIFGIYFFLRYRNNPKPVQEADSYYLIVNPETSKVVDKLRYRTPEEKKHDNTPLRKVVTVLTLTEYLLLHFIAVCVVLFNFVPETVQTFLFWIICISSVIVGIIMLLLNFSSKD